MFKALKKIRLVLGDAMTCKKSGQIYTGGMTVIINKDETVEIDPKPSNYTAQAWGFAPIGKEKYNADTELRGN